MLPLFDCIADHPLDDKEALWSALNPSIPFNDQQLRLLMSYLHKLMETYVSLSEWSSDEVNQRMTLAAGYRKRGMNVQFAKAQQAATKLIKNRPWRDGEFHHVRYQLMWEEYALQTIQNPTDAASFQEMVHHVDASYLSNRLRLICMAYAQRQVYHTTLETLDVTEVITMASSPVWTDTPAVKLYLACYRMLREPDKIDHFHIFTKALEQNRSVFAEEEIRGLYQQAINYCIRRLNSGDDLFFQEVFKII